MSQTSKVTPAVWGGLFTGVLSSLPIVAYVNACCCLWVTGGGIVSAYLLQQNQSEPIEIGDGAQVGLMAGVIGAVVSTIASIVVKLVVGPLQERWLHDLLDRIQNLPPEVESALDSFAGSGAAIGLSILGAILGFGFMLVIGMIFSTFGGVLGALMFRKKDAPIAGPPEMQSF